MNHRILFQACLIAFVAGAPMAGGAYVILTPMEYSTWPKTMNIIADGSTDMGEDVDVDLYDGGGIAGEHTIIVSATATTWRTSFSPPQGTGQFVTGLGYIMLYKQGETMLRDSIYITIGN